MEIGVREETIEQRRHRIAGHDRTPQYPRCRHRQRRARQQRQLPRPYSAFHNHHKRHRQDRHQSARKLDCVAEPRRDARRRQIAHIARVSPHQQCIKRSQREEDATRIGVGGRSSDAGDRRAKVEHRRCQCYAVRQPQPPSDPQHQRYGRQQQRAVYQPRRRVPSECEGRHKQHFQALRQHFVEAYAVGKAAQAHIFSRQSQVIRACIRLQLRRQQR